MTVTLGYKLNPYLVSKGFYIAFSKTKYAIASRESVGKGDITFFNITTIFICLLYLLLFGKLNLPLEESWIPPFFFQEEGCCFCKRDAHHSKFKPMRLSVSLKLYPRPLSREAWLNADGSCSLRQTTLRKCLLRCDFCYQSSHFGNILTY